MVDLHSARDHIRDPLAWAADCEAQLDFDIEPEAKAAFRQLAAEFQAAALEIEGLVSAFEAVIRRKQPRQLDGRPRSPPRTGAAHLVPPPAADRVTTMVPAQIDPNAFFD